MKLFFIFCILLVNFSYSLQASINSKKLTISSIKFNGNNMVKMGITDSLNIVGLVKADKLKAYLKGTDFKPKSVFGHSTVLISVSYNDEFVGCGCPKEFNELAVFYQVEGKSFNSFVIGHQISNHPQRTFSMNTKFGSMAKNGEIDIDLKTGFIVYDEFGDKVIELTKEIKDNLLPLKSKIIFDFYTTGRDLGIARIGKKITLGRHFTMELFEGMKAATQLIQEGQFYLNERSRFGSHLSWLEFKPKFLLIQKVRNALTTIQD